MRKIREQCLGQFPFIRESQLRQERVAYAAGSSLKPGGSGNSATYRLDLPTIDQTQFSGILTDVGSLADEYALNPILWGWEPQFDFVGDANRGLLAVGRGWQLFLFGGRPRAPPSSRSTRSRSGRSRSRRARGSGSWATG